MIKKQIRLKKEYLREREKEREAPKPDYLNSKKDNEYQLRSYEDPRVLITSSRAPSARLKQFQKEMTELIPNATAMNRGANKIKDIFDYGIQKDFTEIILIHENKGEPDGLIVSHLPVGPTIFFGLTGVVLRHDVDKNKDKYSQAYPHLIFHNLNDRIGERIKIILQNLFPAPLNQKSKRTISFIAEENFISMRHHNYEKKDYKTVELFEVGPRFELRPYMIKLGSLIDNSATIEWSMKSFINTATKNNQIAN